MLVPAEGVVDRALAGVEHQDAGGVGQRAHRPGFQIELVFVLSALLHDEVAEEGQWAGVGDGREGERCQEAGAAAGQLAENVLGQRRGQGAVSPHPPVVEKDAGVEHALGGRLGHPVAELPLPAGHAQAPLRVTGHHVAGAVIIAGYVEVFRYVAGEFEEIALHLGVAGGGDVGEDQGVVLVGPQQLLAAALAAEGEPVEKGRRVAVAVGLHPGEA